MFNRLQLLIQVCITTLVIVWLAHAAAQDAPVRVFLEGPRLQFEPGHIRLRVRVEPHPDNRGLTVAAISDGYARSSYEQLDDHSPRTRWIEYRDVPAGEYDVIAALSRADGSSRQDHAALSVIGRGF